MGRAFAVKLSFLLLVFLLYPRMEARAMHDASLTILALGDSTTAGTPGFFSPAEKPPAGWGDEKSQYAYWILQRHPEWTVFNRGVRGQRSDQILWRFERELTRLKPDVVVVLAGVNDLYQGYSVEDIKANLQKIYSLALENNIRVMACTILPYNESTDQIKQKMAETNDWIRSHAKQYGFLFCDTFALLDDPKNPGNLAGTPDGIHPDVAGYRRMGKAIERVLNQPLVVK